MGMTIDEIITKETEIVQEYKKIIDTHMISENMSLEEVYYGNTELIEAVLKTHKEWVDYHNTIANIMHKYQQIEKILNKDFKDYHPLDRNPIRLSLIREVVEDGSDTNS